MRAMFALASFKYQSNIANPLHNELFQILWVEDFLFDHGGLWGAPTRPGRRETRLPHCDRIYFSKVPGRRPGRLREVTMISEHAALIYTMVLVSAADRDMTDSELRVIGTVVTRNNFV